LNQEQTSTLVPADIGAPFEGGFYGGQIRSNEKRYAVVWAPRQAGEITGAWLDEYKSVPDARSCFHSMDNTVAMAAAGSKLAKAALAAEINGHRDWCIPARDVLELAYRHLKPSTEETEGYFRDGDNPSSLPPGYPYAIDKPLQTAAAAFRGNGAEAFQEAIYWSSTQCSEYHAWGQYFSNGSQDHDYKEFEALARLGRLIQLTA
jgi:hypothetical protein